jgi:DNA polymerase-3 subunit chi
MKPSCEIIFLRVTDNESKIKRLTNGVHSHFCRGHRLMIAVANDAAARYIDQLLWRLPAESFMPHAISLQPAQEPIVISSSLKNLNGATVLFNLRPEAHPQFSEYQIVYDLMDESDPSKHAQALQRQQGYPYSRLA